MRAFTRLLISFRLRQASQREVCKAEEGQATHERTVPLL
jgi:hypothetical protein